MIKLNRNASRRFEQRTRGQKLYFGSFKKTGGEKGFLIRKLVSLRLLPQNVGTFCYQKLWSACWPVKALMLPPYPLLRPPTLLRRWHQ
jgi:hypothetical protein